MILTDTIIRVFCADGHKRWQVGEFAIARADPSDGLPYFPDAPPLWVFAEEFGKLNRKKWTRSGRVKIGEGGRYISDNRLGEIHRRRQDDLRHGRARRGALPPLQAGVRPLPASQQSPRAGSVSRDAQRDCGADVYLLHSQPRFAQAEVAYQNALAELRNRDAANAITDAGTALQEVLMALGCDGGSLGDLLTSAKKGAREGK